MGLSLSLGQDSVPMAVCSIRCSFSGTLICLYTDYVSTSTADSYLLVGSKLKKN
jgi:hypothetical protein